MKQILIGYLGNPILGNDAVGIQIGEELLRFERFASDHPEFEFTIRELLGSPMNLLEDIRGFDGVVLIDALVLPSQPVGKVLAFGSEELSSMGTGSHIHGLNLPEVLHLAGGLGIELPERFTLVGVVVPLSLSFTAAMDRNIEERLPEIIESVISIIREFLDVW